MANTNTTFDASDGDQTHGVALTGRTGLVVCGLCHDLAGPPDGRGTFREARDRYQECVCEQAIPWDGDRHARPSELARDEDPVTGGYRQGRRILCKTCAAEVIDDFSRWTVWHCRDCRDRVVALNTRRQRLVLPLGKHSLVNQSSIRSGGAADRGGDSADGLLGLLDRVDAGRERLAPWVRARTARNLARAGLPTDRDVPVGAYVDAMEDVDLDKAAVFDELLRYLADS